LDEYNAGLEEGSDVWYDDDARRIAIRRAMEMAGHVEDDIVSALAALGLKEGGRVGFDKGGLGTLVDPMMKKESKWLSKVSPTKEVDTIHRIYEEGGNEALQAYLERNPDLTDKYIINADAMSGELFVMPNKLHPDNMDMENIIMIDTGNNVEIMNEMFKENKAKGGRINKEGGGMMSVLPKGTEMDYRGGGMIPMGSKERADDVPARLSKNEFVMTADAVRAAGGGSVNVGAKRMYDLMHNLEARV
jgi:hypothetical protein